MPGRVWTQERLIETIRQLNEQGVDLSPTAIQKTHGALFSSARSRSHFGNWRDAIQAAGLSYDDIKRVKQRWSREEILQQIKQCHTCGEDLLHPSFKEKNRSLYLAACAHRYFRLVASCHSRRRPRSRNACAKAASGPKHAFCAPFRKCRMQGQPLGWAHIKNVCPGIYRAARRKENFGSWHNALIAAGIEPAPRGRGRRPNALKELERGLARDLDTPAQPMVYDGDAPSLGSLRESSLEALSSR
jgi:hypothetical protein